MKLVESGHGWYHGNDGLSTISKLIFKHSCIFAHEDGNLRGGVLPLYVCVPVCFFCTISKNPMHLGLPNLTEKCSTMSFGNPFILGSKGYIMVMSHSNIASMGPYIRMSADCLFMLIVLLPLCCDYGI